MVYVNQDTYRLLKLNNGKEYLKNNKVYILVLKKAKEKHVCAEVDFP